MFDIGWSEMMVVAVLTLLIMGPKELPNTLRSVSKWIRKAKGLAREFQSGVDDVIREADLQEARKALEGSDSESIRKTIEDVIDPTQSLTKTTQAVKEGVEALTKSSQEVKSDVEALSKEDGEEVHNPFSSIQKPASNSISGSSVSVSSETDILPEKDQQEDPQEDKTTISKSS